MRRRARQCARWPAHASFDDALAVGIAELVESYVSRGASLAAFFALFFMVFWVGWQLAVRVTAPLANKT
jgi:hypothetical protein